MSEAEQEQVFNEWLSLHKGLLFKITRAYASSAEDRDDLFQDILFQMWKSVPNFQGQSAVSTWLYRVALNTALKWKGKEIKHLSRHETLHDRVVWIEEDHSKSNEKIEWLYRQIAKLNEVDRSLCLMILDNLSYKEMAEILGISEANVAVKIHRIKKYLVEQSKSIRDEF